MSILKDVVDKLNKRIIEKTSLDISFGYQTGCRDIEVIVLTLIDFQHDNGYNHVEIYSSKPPYYFLAGLENYLLERALEVIKNQIKYFSDSDDVLCQLINNKK